MNLIARDNRIMIPTYRRLTIEIARADGVRLYDKSGKSYLDLFGGLAVNLLGHRNPCVLEAIRQQLDRYAHLSNYYLQEPQISLAERLSEKTGMDLVFFCNSGSEATESAIKLARKWGRRRGKHVLLGFTGAFHGRTTGALSLMSKASYRNGYAPFLGRCARLPFNDSSRLRAAVTNSTAAVFLECIQGEGGIVPIKQDFADALSELRDAFGFLLITDEVQAGLGRTGAFLAGEHWKLKPDVVLLAKGLGGGLPLGALLVKEDLGTVYGLGGHGSTFGGNPVACAAGDAVLRVLENERLVERAARIGERLMGAFGSIAEEYPALIHEIRGKGCMIGIEMGKRTPAFANACLEHGALVNITNDATLRLLPPLTLSDDDVSLAVSIFRRAASDLHDRTNQPAEK